MSVNIIKINNIDVGAIEDAIKKSFSSLNIDITNVPDRILIKPNMCYYSPPSTGEVTDPKFVGIIIDVIRDLMSDPDIFIIESDASAMKCQHVFKFLGYDKLSLEKDVKLINLSENKVNKINVNVNNKSFDFYISDIFNDPYYLINVPKLKYMINIKISCALKNIFGCNSLARKYVYHKDLNESIVGINKLIKSNLIISDGIYVNGKITKKMGLIMSSSDPVAFDSAAAYIMGLNPNTVKYLLLSEKEGLGKRKYNSMGCDIKEMRKYFPKKNIEDDVMKILSYFYNIFLA